MISVSAVDEPQAHGWLACGYFSADSRTC